MELLSAKPWTKIPVPPAVGKENIILDKRVFSSLLSLYTYIPLPEGAKIILSFTIFPDPW